MSKNIKNEMKRSLKVLKRKTLESVLKLRVNENKQTEYTKKLMKEISVGKCMEVGDKCNSMIRTKREDWAWWNMQCGNWIPSQWHE